MSNDLFLTASQKKYRFSTNKGAVSTEDLWDLSLETLDTLAVAADTKVNATRKTFIGKRDASAADDTNKLEILKAVIEIKMTAAAAAKDRVKKKEQAAFLKTLLEKKQLATMESLSEDEIRKQLASLEAE